MMARIRDVRVGVRLAVSLGLIAALLTVIVGVGLSTASKQRGAQDRIVRATDVRRDLFQMKVSAAAANSSQVAYALAASRGEAGATNDDVGHRKQFLADIQAFRD